MKRILQLLNLIFGIPNSIIINFRYFPFRIAIRLPIILSQQVCLKSLNGNIEIVHDKISTGLIKIGFGDVGIFDKKRRRSILQIEGIVRFNGKCNIGHGSKISVNKGGILEIGKDFEITAESSIVVNKNIRFGDNCLISWENLFMDTDFHKILNEKNNVINEDKEIIIGDNVWIGCRSTILKGSIIPSNSVVAASSVLCGNYEGENQIFGGNPAKVLKNNVFWRK